MRTPRKLVAVVAAAVLTTSCAGPFAPIDIGTKEVSIDLLLGAKVKKVAQAPVPPMLLPEPTVFTPVPRPPRRNGATTTSTTQLVDPGPCPEAHPLASPEKVAYNTVAGVPVQATYEYRTQGKLSSGSTTYTEVVPAPVSTVTITPGQKDIVGNFDFQMKVENANTGTTTTTYRVIVPTQSGTPDVPPLVDDVVRPSTAPSGIYLAKVATEGDIRSFEPQFPGIQIARLPLDLGTVFDAAGSDGTTTMSWRSRVKEKANVDACGTLLDSYVIELSNGQIASAQHTELLEFKSTLHIGTQYGGLLLSIATETSGTTAPDIPVSRVVNMTISREPSAP
jgi:hypothetical protein